MRRKAVCYVVGKWEDGIQFYLTRGSPMWISLGESAEEFDTYDDAERARVKMAAYPSGSGTVYVIERRTTVREYITERPAHAPS